MGPTVSAPTGMKTVASQNQDRCEVFRCHGRLFIGFLLYSLGVPFVFPTLLFSDESGCHYSSEKNNKGYGGGEKKVLTSLQRLKELCQGELCLLQGSHGKQQPLEMPGPAKPCSKDSLYFGSKRESRKPHELASFPLRILCSPIREDEGICSSFLLCVFSERR